MNNSRGNQEDYSIILLLFSALHPLQSSGKLKQKQAWEVMNRLLPPKSALLLWTRPGGRSISSASIENPLRMWKKIIIIIIMSGGEITQQAMTLSSPRGVDFGQADIKI